MKRARRLLGAVAAAAIAGLSVSGCDSPTGGGGPILPESVGISGSTAPLPQGGQRQFSAAVVPAGAPQAVVWSVDAATSDEVTVAGGLLVARAPQGSQIIIRATAVGHPEVYATAAITVAAPVAPASVEVTPASAYVGPDGQRQFSATVGPEGAPQAVTWSIDPAGAGDITPEGLLQVDAAPGTSITVIATAAGTAVSGTAVATVAARQPIPINVTGIPARYRGMWGDMSLVIPGTLNEDSWAEAEITGASATFTVSAVPGIYDIILTFFGASHDVVYRASSIDISAGANTLPFGQFALVPHSITITVTNIPAAYRGGWGDIELLCPATGNFVDWGWSETEVTGASAVFRFWFVQPGTYDVDLWISGTGRWGRAVATAVSIGATATIPWSAFDFVDGGEVMGEVMSVTVTGIPARYHGDWGDLSLFAPGTQNDVAFAYVPFVTSSTTFMLGGAEPGTFDVVLYLNDFGVRYALPSSRHISAGAVIPFNDFALAPRGFAAEPERAERALPGRRPGARQMRERR